MLAMPQFLTEFVRKHSGNKIEIKNAKIVREEKSFPGKRIDLCIYIKDINDINYGFVIEAKVHWPNDDQLTNSVAILKKTHPGYNISGLHFLSTVEEKQLSALSSNTFKHPLILAKEFIRDYCLSGIEHGYSLRLANDLHQLLNYEKT